MKYAKLGKFFLPFTIVLFSIPSLQAQEFLVCNGTYEISASATKAENLWYDIGGPTNWKSPYDYYNGQFYIRYEIISQPTKRQCMLQFAMWQDVTSWSIPDWKEQAGSQVTMSGPGDVQYVNSSPASWWKYRGVSLDFSRPKDFHYIGVMFWSKDPRARLAKYLTSPTHPEYSQATVDVWNDRYDWLPLKFKYTIVAVAKGHTFSGNWDKYMKGGCGESVGGGDPPPPPPPPDPKPKGSSLSVEAEGITKIGYSTQDNNNASMSKQIRLSGSSGNAYFSFPHSSGNYDITVDYLDESDGASSFSLRLNGLQIGSWTANNVSSGSSFRTYSLKDVNIKKGDQLRIYCNANGGEEGILDYIDFSRNGNISCTEPAYSVNFTAETTTGNIGTNDQYSYNNSSWTNGSNNKVAVTPGETIYFRAKDETACVQSLNVPSRPGAPSYSVNYPAESTEETVSSSHIYSSASDMSAAATGSGLKLFLTPGNNVYIAAKATSSAFRSQIKTLSVPNRPGTPDFGIDYVNERSKSKVNAGYEYSTSSNMNGSQTGTADYIKLTPGTDMYFRKLATASAFRSQIQHLKVSKRSTVQELTIDYLNEMSNEALSNAYLYDNKSNMSAAKTGNGTKLALEPGVNLYYQKKANASGFASEVERLDVPERPAAMLLEIDFENEQTVQSLSTDYEYSSSPGFTNPQVGADAPLQLEPGDDIYYRKGATTSSFHSEIAFLAVPERPETPVYTINYREESTAENIGDSVKYSTSPEMERYQMGSNWPIGLMADTVYYFCLVPGSSSFASGISSLSTPSRGEAPVAEIDFVTETTVGEIDASIEYSYGSGFKALHSGDEGKIEIVPGDAVFMRYVSTDTSFSSQILQLLPPERPVLVASDGEEPLRENPVSLTIVYEGEFSDTLSEEDFEITNGTISALIDSVSFEVQADEEGILEVMLLANTLNGAHFASEVYVIDFDAIPSFVIEITENNLKLYPNPSNGIINLEWQDADSKDYSIKVFDKNGRLVQEERYFGNLYSLDLSHQPSGLYILNIMDDEGELIHRKVILSK